MSSCDYGIIFGGICEQFYATNDWCAAIAFAPAFTGRESAMTGRNIIQLNFGPVFAIIKSANAYERETIGYSAAWLHHKGRNRHHYEYWIDLSSDYSKGLQGMPMAPRYVVEMFCDRMAASRNYNLENYNDRLPLEYSERGKSRYTMHPETAELLERLLHMLAEEGEDKTFAYIRNELDLKHSRWH